MEIRLKLIGGRVDPDSDIFNAPQYLSVETVFNKHWFNVKDVIHYYSGESLKEALTNKQGFAVKANKECLERKYVLHFYDKRPSQIVTIPKPPKYQSQAASWENRVSIKLEPLDGFDGEGNKIELDGTGQYL